MKKQWFMSLLLFCLPWMAALAQQKEGTRVEHLMNFDWKFILGDVEGAEALVFDDSTWQSLDIPHDFQFDMPWSEQAGRNRSFKEMGVAGTEKPLRPIPPGGASDFRSISKVSCSRVTCGSTDS